MNIPDSCLINREITELEKCEKAYRDAMSIRPYSAHATEKARKAYEEWYLKYSAAIERFSDVESLEKIEKLKAPTPELRKQLEMLIILSGAPGHREMEHAV